MSQINILKNIIILICLISIAVILYKKYQIDIANEKNEDKNFKKINNIDFNALQSFNSKMKYSSGELLNVKLAKERTKFIKYDFNLEKIIRESEEITRND